MKDRVISYIHDFNRVARATIEYAALEPFFSASGKPFYNLHMVYAPRTELLIQDYLSGSNATDVKVESVAKQQHLIKPMLDKFGTMDKNDIIPFDEELFASLGMTVISNIGRFYNFSLSSPTDPFLSMYLEPENIVYVSPQFQNTFLANKSVFQPSPRYMIDILSQELLQQSKKAGEYGIYNNKDKYGELLGSLNKTMKLYFIVINYVETGTLASLCSDRYITILNTLSQASKPWDFITECIQNLEKLRRDMPETQWPGIEQAALKQKCFEFLTQRLLGDLNAERNFSIVV